MGLETRMMRDFLTCGIISHSHYLSFVTLVNFGKKKNLKAGNQFGLFV